ncbi:hypothetical protein [Arthrobacter sp. UYEF3]|uniref:hypothetical protein n=1 Tax=Arthrobacter sp. UYEF3 TaxID=1756365 RepID=UPI003396CEE6
MFHRTFMAVLLGTGIKNISVYGIGYTQEQKGVIPLSGKSLKSGSAKKTGKTIIEKRAEKRAKNESGDGLFAKPRKNQR